MKLYIICILVIIIIVLLIFFGYCTYHLLEKKGRTRQIERFQNIYETTTHYVMYGPGIKKNVYILKTNIYTLNSGVKVYAIYHDYKVKVAAVTSAGTECYYKSTESGIPSKLIPANTINIASYFNTLGYIKDVNNNYFIDIMSSYAMYGNLLGSNIPILSKNVYPNVYPGTLSETAYAIYYGDSVKICIPYTGSTKTVCYDYYTVDGIVPNNFNQKIKELITIGPYSNIEKFNIYFVDSTSGYIMFVPTSGLSVTVYTHIPILSKHIYTLKTGETAFCIAYEGTIIIAVAKPNSIFECYSKTTSIGIIPYDFNINLIIPNYTQYGYIKEYNNTYYVIDTNPIIPTTQATTTRATTTTLATTTTRATTTSPQTTTTSPQTTTTRPQTTTTSPQTTTTSPQTTTTSPQTTTTSPQTTTTSPQTTTDLEFIMLTEPTTTQPVFYSTTQYTTTTTTQPPLVISSINSKKDVAPPKYDIGYLLEVS